MRQEEEMLCRSDSSENKPTESARFLNMRKLVWEFNRMQKRFIQVEHMAERLRTEKDKVSIAQSFASHFRLYVKNNFSFVGREHVSTRPTFGRTNIRAHIYPHAHHIIYRVQTDACG